MTVDSGLGKGLKLKKRASFAVFSFIGGRLVWRSKSTNPFELRGYEGSLLLTLEN